MKDFTSDKTRLAHVKKLLEKFVSVEEKGVKPISVAIGPAEARELLHALDSSVCPVCKTTCHSCERDSFLEKKLAFHKKYYAAFRTLAKLLGLPKTAYRLESNKAGSGSMGEVTFHTDYAYAQALGTCFQGEALLIRACRDKKDFTGFENAYHPLSILDGDMKEVLSIFRNLKKLRDATKKATVAP